MTAQSKNEVIKKQYCPPEWIEQHGEPAWFVMRLKKGAFNLTTRPGPAEVVYVGDLVVLHDKWFVEMLFFTGRGEPVDPGVAEEAEYEVRRPFRTTIDGLYKDIPQNARLRLTREEALGLMRRHLVRPLDENTFYLP